MVLVVKLGGGASLDIDAVLRDLATLAEPWILVHGGNAELTELSTRLGHAPRFVTSPSGYSSRVTDLDTIADIQRAYRGRINNDLVLRLQRLGVNAVGLSGVDGKLLEAERKEAIRVVENGRKFLLRDDYTGRVVRVNVALLRLLLDNGYRPVVTLPALANDGSAVNVDGDRAAAAIAAALGAKDLLILSNVPGLLRDVADPSTLIAHIPKAQLASGQDVALDRMKKKLLGAEEALAGGVARVVLGSANRERPVQDALAGQGTVIA
ncbi:MAG: [amino group carrier protein]-L-2-aminoadipate 6-kinase [Thermoplasmata archaeon]|jgi:acetylglutamate/LysW-gamma-L-alpha-aminoadipate kinase|nr:[amino group carrier protein]-L-2-aminoadipate 6-kinase [Thermoplasmata archaeon]